MIRMDTKHGEAFEEAWGIEPITKILEKALSVLHPYGCGPLEANWLATHALRAVAEAVVRDGCLPTPLHVDLRLAGAEDGYGSERQNEGMKSKAPLGNVILFPSGGHYEGSPAA